MVFPVRDENPQIRTPYVTYALIAINVIVWLTVQGAGSPELVEHSVCRYGVIPGDLLREMTVSSALRVCPQLEQANWFSLLSTMFMHGSWMHLLGNMWFLWIFGNNVEDSMGPFRFALFYLLAGLAATAAQVGMDTASLIPMVGASGAIGGVMGAYIILYPKVHVHLFVLIFFRSIVVPAVATLALWIALQAWGAYSSTGAEGGGTAFWAHIGGFAAGALLVFLFKNESLLAAHPYRGWHQRAHADRVFKPVDRSTKRGWH